VAFTTLVTLSTILSSSSPIILFPFLSSGEEGTASTHCQSQYYWDSDRSRSRCEEHDSCRTQPSGRQRFRARSLRNQGNEPRDYQGALTERNARAHWRASEAQERLAPWPGAQASQGCWVGALVSWTEIKYANLASVEIVGSPSWRATRLRIQRLGRCPLGIVRNGRQPNRWRAL